MNTITSENLNAMNTITSENPIRSRLHNNVYHYDKSRYPFKEKLEELFGCKANYLHKHIGDFQVFRRENDQSTLAHKVFYANYEKLIKPLYESFQLEIVSPIINEEFYYQLIPTFRIGLPGNKFVGEYHKDSKYNHQSYEVNFNLGICGYTGEAALKVESSEGSNEFYILESPYGTIFSFDHIDCLHGSDINNTNETMISFDFRLAIKSLYYKSNAASVNKKSKFEPGSYFSSHTLAQN